MNPLRLAATLLIALAALSASADKTTRRGLKASPQPAVSAAACDTVDLSPGMVVLSGYDKPLKSNRESLFVTNRYTLPLTWLSVRLTYTDTSGRILHERIVAVRVSVPPQATRQAVFRSWDRQLTMYYVGTGKPRTSDGTPYDIAATPLRAVFGKP